MNDEDVEKAVEYITVFLSLDAKIDYEFIIGNYDFLYTETLPPIETSMRYLPKRHKFKVYSLNIKNAGCICEFEVPYYANEVVVKRILMKAVK